MRWDNLFSDLESQLAQELTAEEADLQAEEERLRLARLGIRDRLFALHRSASGASMRTIRLELSDGLHIDVEPSSFGRDWFSGRLVTEGARTSECIVPIEAVTSVSLRREQVAVSLDQSAPEETPAALSARLGLGVVLRDLCRRRHPITIHRRAGSIHGTIDRVGRDHLDIAVHEAGAPRRQTGVSEFRIVLLSEITLVRI
jgi:hypothetical protein